MSSKNMSSSWLTITIGSIAIAAIVIYAFSGMKKSKGLNKNNREHMIAEFYESAPHKHLPAKSYSGSSQYAIWIAPGVQPHLSSAIRKYGGYHIKLMPMQPMNLPPNFSLDRVLLKFPSDVNHRWNLMLPKIHINVVHTRSHLALMMINGADTLTLLRKFFQTTEGGLWKSLHSNNTSDAEVSKSIDSFNYMGLGSDDPYDQVKPNAFTYQTQWYVQLIKGPEFEWVNSQRVMLYAAKGLQG